MMDTTEKEMLWADLRNYQENLIIKRFVTAVENCLLDLKTSPSSEDLLEVGRFCAELVKYPPLRRGIDNCSLDVWKKVYERTHGAPPQAGNGSGSSDKAPHGS